MQQLYPLLWAVFAIVLLTQILPAVITLFRLLRIDFQPMHVARLPTDTVLPPLHKAAVDEIAALGFTPFAIYTMTDVYDSCTAVMLKHNSMPIFANVYLRPGAFMCYPAWFWAFAADGKIIMTSNRQPLSQALRNVEQADMYQPGLPQHFAAHLARLKDRPLHVVTEEDAFARITGTTADYLDYNIAEGNMVAENGMHFLKTGAAWRMTCEMLRRRQVLRKAYATVVTGDATRSAFFAEVYQTFDLVKRRLKQRRSLSAALLFISLGISFGLFYAWLGWRPAAAVILVLLVHECGHALAMRLFGYRDMNMFFIPFMGAAVTGTAKNVPVWKQAIVLLAGPVPGLLFGIGMLLFSPYRFAFGSFPFILAIQAAVINIFNLLPLSFLDGGKLVEIALLSRWPYALFAFAVASSLAMAGIIVYMKTYNMLFLALLFVAVARVLWRMARVRAALDKTGPQDLTGLFALTEKTIRSKFFFRQHQVVRSIYEAPMVLPPRGWEIAFTLLLFFASWGIAGGAWMQWKQERRIEANFDRSVDNYYRHYKDGPAAVITAAKTLSPDDPRQIDALVLPAMRLAGAERMAAIEHILLLRRDGHAYARRTIVSTYLNYVYFDTQEDTPPLRIDALQKAIAKMGDVAPDKFADTVDARLRLAELQDRNGDSAAAKSALADLLTRTENTVDDDGARGDVIAAQAWFYIDKEQPDQALAFLANPAYAPLLQQPGEPAVAYAWALLAAGKVPEGAAQMARAALLLKDGEASAENLNLIYAAWKSGHTEKAQGLVSPAALDEYCAPNDVRDYISEDFWRRKQLAGVLDAMKTICTVPASPE